MIVVRAEFLTVFFLTVVCGRGWDGWARKEEEREREEEEERGTEGERREERGEIRRGRTEKRRARDIFKKNPKFLTVFGPVAKFLTVKFLTGILGDFTL